MVCKTISIHIVYDVVAMQYTRNSRLLLHIGRRELKLTWINSEACSNRISSWALLLISIDSPGIFTYVPDCTALKSPANILITLSMLWFFDQMDLRSSHWFSLEVLKGSSISDHIIIVNHLSTWLLLFSQHSLLRPHALMPGWTYVIREPSTSTNIGQCWMPIPALWWSTRRTRLSGVSITS